MREWYGPRGERIVFRAPKDAASAATGQVLLARFTDAAASHRAPTERDLAHLIEWIDEHVVEFERAPEAPGEFVEASAWGDMQVIERFDALDEVHPIALVALGVAIFVEAQLVEDEVKEIRDYLHLLVIDGGCECPQCRGEDLEDYGLPSTVCVSAAHPFAARMRVHVWWSYRDEPLLSAPPWLGQVRREFNAIVAKRDRMAQAKEDKSRAWDDALRAHGYIQ